MTDAALLPALADPFKAAMRRLGATVSIVTTEAGGSRTGMTATAVSSLCAEPPSLIVCVNRSASLHPLLAEGASLCVNLLSEGQEELSAVFGSGKVQGEARFAHGSWRSGPNGAPALGGAQANLFGTVERLVDYGTHTIVILRVTSVTLAEDGAPLLYLDGRYLAAAAA